MSESIEWSYDPVMRGRVAIKRPATPSWSGEGLPPVGSKIENKSDYKGWSVVILHRHGAALVEQEDGVAADYVLIGKSLCFPARTPSKSRRTSGRRRFRKCEKFIISQSLKVTTVTRVRSQCFTTPAIASHNTKPATDRRYYEHSL